MTLIEAIRLSREFHWLAIDESNMICAYDSEPSCSSDDDATIWFVNHGCYEVIGNYTGHPIPWKESLIELSEIKCK